MDRVRDVSIQWWTEWGSDPMFWTTEKCGRETIASGQVAQRPTLHNLGGFRRDGHSNVMTDYGIEYQILSEGFIDWLTWYVFCSLLHTERCVIRFTYHGEQCQGPYNCSCAQAVFLL